MKTQRGAVLLLSLIILLVLSLLALSGMQGSVNQVNMATAQRDGIMALEIAETGLREVQGILDGLPDMDQFGVAQGFRTADQEVLDEFDDATWTGNQVAAATPMDGITPRYFVQEIGNVTLSGGELPRDMSQPAVDEVSMNAVRIVVMAQGPSGQSRRIIESFYVFRPDGLNIPE